jgi:dTDP-4-dehydrorhamnose 3,5-epimerase
MRKEHSSIIDGLITITPDVFSDTRGAFLCTYNARDYVFTDAAGAPIDFVEDDLSISKQNVIRGLHGDSETWKLVQCVHGALSLVVADLRAASPTWLRWQSFDLNDQTRLQVLIPAGCATGLACLSPLGIMAYKQNRLYDGAARQFTVRWDDPMLGIAWPIADPILSARDAEAPMLD